MNNELIRNLHNAMYFLNIEGHGMSADHVKEAIAALSAKPKCDCHLHHQQVCDICQGVTGKDADAKPEPLPEVEAFLNAYTMDDNTIEAKNVEAYLHQLTAAHKAELAEKSEEVESYKAAFSLADDKWQECIAKLEEAEAKGRREALQNPLTLEEALNIAAAHARGEE